MEYKNSVTHYIAKWMVDILLILGIVSTIAIPWIAKYIIFYFDYGLINHEVLLLILFISALSADFILFKIRQMFKTLLGGNPFVEQNISCFRQIAVACAVIALTYIAKCIILFTLSSFIIVVVFVIGCLFCLTLKDIFKQAVYYKQENDWTV